MILVDLFKKLLLNILNSIKYDRNCLHVFVTDMSDSHHGLLVISPKTIGAQLNTI